MLSNYPLPAWRVKVVGKDGMLRPWVPPSPAESKRKEVVAIDYGRNPVCPPPSGGTRNTRKRKKASFARLLMDDDELSRYRYRAVICTYPDGREVKYTSTLAASVATGEFRWEVYCLCEGKGGGKRPRGVGKRYLFRYVK